MKITMKMPHSFAPMIPGVDRKSDTGSSRTGGIGGGIGTGMLSILMVLIILLLSAFAVLSYSAARAENRLTEKTIQSAQDYYAADRRAEDMQDPQFVHCRSRLSGAQNQRSLITIVSPGRTG